MSRLWRYIALVLILLSLAISTSRAIEPMPHRAYLPVLISDTGFREECAPTPEPEGR